MHFSKNHFALLFLILIVLNVYTYYVLNSYNTNSGVAQSYLVNALLFYIVGLLVACLMDTQPAVVPLVLALAFLGLFYQFVGTVMACRFIGACNACNQITYFSQWFVLLIIVIIFIVLLAGIWQLHHNKLTVM